MFTASVFVGLLFLLICIIVFIGLSNSNRKKEKQLLGQLKELASENNYTITQYDLWDQFAIGMDDAANIVLMVNNTNQPSSRLEVNLSEVLHCNFIKTNRQFIGQPQDYKEIGKIELVFINRNKQRPTIVMEFYNFDKGGSSLSGELQLAEKWYNIISNRKAAFKKATA